MRVHGCTRAGEWFSPSSPGQQPSLSLGTCPQPSGLTPNLLGCKLQVRDSETGVSPSPPRHSNAAGVESPQQSWKDRRWKQRLSRAQLRGGPLFSMTCSVFRPTRTAFETRGRSVFPIRGRKRGSVPENGEAEVGRAARRKCQKTS